MDVATQVTMMNTAILATQNPEPNTNIYVSAFIGLIMVVWILFITYAMITSVIDYYR